MGKVGKEWASAVWGGGGAAKQDWHTNAQRECGHGHVLYWI